ncbi:MAG TPA: choice-of-anchor Q domain-containing protein [Candidatus Limnocylindria bacterium]|jgi:hypothetical protein
MRRRWLAVGIGPLLALGALLMAVTPVAAAGVVGTGTAASCTEAAFDAAFTGGGTVTFNCGPGTVGITFTGTKVLTADTTIDGAGAIALNGNDTVQMFTTDGFDLTLQGLIITDAHSDGFGGVVSAGNATVAFVDTHVVDSTASFGAVASIFALNGGTATIAASGSTFVGNEASNSGGVFFLLPSSFDGEFCDVTPSAVNGIIVNSTFTENSAPDGAIMEIRQITPCGDTGNAVVAYSTFAGNTGDELFLLVDASSAGLSAQVAANVFGPNEADCADAAAPATFVSLGYNVTDDASCLTTTTGDQVVANTLLGPLADNGGLTETMALLAGSPALDAIPPGSAECGDIPDDQRGVVRPQGTNCDAGAYEQVLLTDTALPALTPSAGLVAIGLGLLWLTLLALLRLASVRRA